MLNQRAKYTANTGMGLLTTANTRLDGGGTLVTILTGGSDGTLIRTVTLKSQASLCSGNMVRLFIEDNEDEPAIKLLQEILIEPEGGGSGSNFATYGLTVYLNFDLKSGYKLRASVNASAKISVIAQGLNWTY